MAELGPETGTFTPTLNFTSTTSVTHTIQDGFYIKIGNTIFFQIFIKTSSIAGSSGQAYIGGLPFSIAQVGAAGAIGTATGLNITIGQSVSARLDTSTGRLSLLVWDSSAGPTLMTVGQWSDNGSVAVSGHYET